MKSNWFELLRTCFEIPACNQMTAKSRISFHPERPAVGFVLFPMRLLMIPRAIARNLAPGTTVRGLSTANDTVLLFHSGSKNPAQTHVNGYQMGIVSTIHTAVELQYL